MTDDTVKNDTLKVAKPGRLQLTKTVESGKVKQNFTHGRSKTVTVEVRKTRTFAQGATGGMVEVKQSQAQPSSNTPESTQALTLDERQTRLKALKSAEEQMKLATERALSKSADAIVPIIIDEPTPPPNEVKRPATAHAPRAPKPTQYTSGDEETERQEARKPGKLKLRGGDEERRSSGKITVQNALSNIEEQRVRSLASMRRQREKALKKAQGVSTSTEKVFREVVIPEAITVQDLANRMAERTVDVIKALMKLGVMATATQSIDADTAELVVGEFGHTFKRVTEGDVENVLKDTSEQEDPTKLQPRPPVVTIMGHVDHGKTSLLDALRKTNVVEGEAGGITQHIGAYQIEINGQKVTFLDTPGHEAFTAMRARGAKITDIVVLVVAGDDGIMEQTKEAISHAKAAGVPVIVAVNKMDKPGADSTRVKNELMQFELVAEEFGGEVMVIEVSAKTRMGLDKLVESILVQAEVLELKANPERAAAGVVVEAKLDQGKGVMTTVLVQKGTLKTGDILVAGPSYGRVRMMINDKGETVKDALPGAPVVVLGLSMAPDAGDTFSVVEDEKTARDISEYRARRQREQSVASQAKTLDSLFSHAAGTNAKELPVIVKADVQGSVEAIIGSVSKYSNEEVTVRVLHSGVGAITESDITLAKATNAMIVAFNVRAAPKAKEQAQRDKVNIRYYSIIYNVVDDVKAMLSGLLAPTLQENFLGYAQIREIFNITKVGKVAGCMVTDGVVKRGNKVRLLRDNVVIHEGTLKTLKRFKDEVKEVKAGLECGMAFENYDDIRENDQIECFEVQEVARTV